MLPTDIIRESLTEARTLVAMLNHSSIHYPVESAASLCTQALGHGKKIMLCGNGGSAADCQHIAAELVGRFSKSRPGLAAIALTTDSSALTAIGNDFGYDAVFSRQVEALASSGDVLIVISTSGNSESVLAAVRAGKAAGTRVIGLTGESGGKLADETMCDVMIRVPSRNTARIQECHILIGHILCQLIEHSIFGGSL